MNDFLHGEGPVLNTLFYVENIQNIDIDLFVHRCKYKTRGVMELQINLQIHTYKRLMPDFTDELNK